MLNNDSRSLIKNLGLGAILILLMVAGSQTIGLSRSGFDFSIANLTLTRFFFYIAPAISFLVGIIFLFIIELIIKKGDSTYGNSLLFNSPGETPALNLSIFKGGLRLFLLSLIIFNVLGLYGAINKQAFTGVGSLENQFSPTDDLIYSSLLIPAAENLGSAFLIACVIFAIRYYARKKNLDKGSFLLFCWLLVPVVVGIYGLLNHILRYSSSDIALLSVFIFWTIGGLITVLSGSFIPFWVLHICNNLFFTLGKMFSNDNTVIITVIAEAVLIGIFFLFFRKYKRNEIT